MGIYSYSLDRSAVWIANFEVLGFLYRFDALKVAFELPDMIVGGVTRGDKGTVRAEMAMVGAVHRSERKWMPVVVND